MRKNKKADKEAAKKFAEMMRLMEQLNNQIVKVHNIQKMSEEDKKKLLEMVEKTELERAKKLKKKFEENGLRLSVGDVRTILEIVEDFLEEEQQIY